MEIKKSPQRRLKLGIWPAVCGLILESGNKKISAKEIETRSAGSGKIMRSPCGNKKISAKEIETQGYVLADHGPEHTGGNKKISAKEIETYLSVRRLLDASCSCGNKKNLRKGD